MIDSDGGLVVGMLEWLHDKMEDKYGRLAAWLVTIAILLWLIAGVVALLMWLY